MSQAILTFGARLATHSPLLLSSYEAIQIGVIYKSNLNPNFFATIDKIRGFIMGIDVLATCYSAAYLANKLERKYHIFSKLAKTLVDPRAFLSVSLLVLTACSLSAMGIAHLINKHLAPTLDIAALREKWSSDILKKDLSLTLSLNRPLREKIRQALHVAGIVVNIALAFFSPYNPIFVFTAACEIVNLALITKRKWLELKKELSSPPNSNFKKITATYTLFLQSISLSNKQGNNCAICTEDNLETQFCSEHAFHTSCLTEAIAHKIIESLREVKIIDSRLITTDHYQNGIYTHTSKRVEYKASLSKSNLPSCPLCRQLPSYNIFSLDIAHPSHPSTTNLVWTP